MSCSMQSPLLAPSSNRIRFARPWAEAACSKGFASVRSQPERGLEHGVAIGSDILFRTGRLNIRDDANPDKFGPVGEAIPLCANTSGSAIYRKLQGLPSRAAGWLSDDGDSLGDPEGD